MIMINTVDNIACVTIIRDDNWARFYVLMRIALHYT